MPSPPLGLVIVYRGSRTINLANGAIGIVGAYMFWELHDQHDLAFFAVAIPAAGRLCAHRCGLLRPVLRALRNAMPLAHILVMVGLLTSIVAIVGLRFLASEDAARRSQDGSSGGSHRA